MYTAHNAVPHIVVWDATSQRKSDKIPFDGKTHIVTCMNATKRSDHLLCSVSTNDRYIVKFDVCQGFSDGQIKIFDLRQFPVASQTLSDHKASV